MKVINRIKKIDKNKVEIAGIIILLLAFAVIIGLDRTILSNFNPINGDFQNYNVLRRLLAGQVPYKDFAVYLGTGHLFLLSLILIIVGNNFTLSLFASNMCTMLIFELFVFSLSFFITKNKKKAVYITLILSLINIVRPASIVKILDDRFLKALDYGIGPGNSARLIRVAIAPICVCLIYLGLKFIDKSKKMTKNKKIIKKIYFAIIAGFSILWSNDGGIATYISVSFIYFLLLIKEYKKDIKSIIKYTFMYIGISGLSFVFLLIIVTKGNIVSWFKFTLGVSSYQKWYYSEAPIKHNISLFDIDINLFNVILILIAIIYIYKIMKANNKKSILFYAFIDVIVIAVIITAYMYQLVSGGYYNQIISLVLFILTCNYIFYILETIIINKKSSHLIKIIIILLSFSTILSKTAEFIVEKRNNRVDAIYIKELGGYLSQYGESIELAKDRIGNEKVFSTYASAVETVTNQFQPTGADYIIHVLGDKQRKDYLDVFNKGNFKYAVTVDRDYNTYKYWIRNSNWFFYRELYKKYKPTFATEYNVFMEKMNQNEIEKNNIKPNIEIECDRQDEYSYKITVKADESINGVVDVKLAYNAIFTKKITKTLNINKYVYIDDITTKALALEDNKISRINYNIPTSSKEYYIPITMIDGKGEINISSYPTKDTYLLIDSIEITDFYDTPYKYCVSSFKYNGNSKDILYIDNTKENRRILSDVKGIKTNEKQAEVIEYQENDSYIELKINGNIQDFLYPNYFEVLK